MSELPSLVDHAEEKETERETRLLWLAHVVICKLKGDNPMSFAKFTSPKDTQKGTEKPENLSSPEEITARFDAIVKADKQRIEVR